jgi:hypothetical protein
MSANVMIIFFIFSPNIRRHDALSLRLCIISFTLIQQIPCLSGNRRKKPARGWLYMKVLADCQFIAMLIVRPYTEKGEDRVISLREVRKLLLPPTVFG